MFNNNIPISRLIGISLLGLVLMVFGFIIQSFWNNENFNNFSNEEIAIFGILLLGFATGLGLMFGQRWARTTMLVIMGVSLALWILGVVVQTSLNSYDAISILGTTIFFVVFGMSVTSVLFNKKVSEEFGEKFVIDEFEDTIDGQFFEKKEEQ